jgi:Pyruvate/2-oxoacid:ferredoxin oxidoreductase delta subunit
MPEDVYRELRKGIDELSFGFPETDSGIELAILRKLFSEEDAATWLLLKPRLETSEKIAQRTGQSPEVMAEHLHDMAERGLIYRVRRGDRVRYATIGFMHGIWEFQLATMDREFAAMTAKYMNDEAYRAVLTRATSGFMRTIPVQRSLDATRHVAAFEDASRFLREAETIAVAECICRKSEDLVGRGCDKPREVCFMMGAMGQYYLDRGMAREVGVDEAIKILAKAQEAGLVTQPATSQNPGGMCNCCGDCCVVLQALNQHPRPADAVFSNYFAAVDQEICDGCETCLDRCQTTAISMNEDEHSEIDSSRCIGCGLCVITCPTEALSLVPKPEGRRRTPPPDSMGQLDLIRRLRRPS